MNDFSRYECGFRTDEASSIFRGTELNWMRDQDQQELAVTVITLAEIYYGLGRWSLSQPRFQSALL